MPVLQIDIYGKIAPKKNSRVFGKKISLPPKSYRHFRRDAVILGWDGKMFPLTGGKWKVSGIIWKPANRADVDNLVTSCLDFLKEVGVIDDDKFFEEISFVQCVDKERPGVTLTIEPFIPESEWMNEHRLRRHAEVLPVSSNISHAKKTKTNPKAKRRATS